jgi:dTDP-4-dehydrorhamnose reductase
MRRVLVTGATGLLGCTLVSALEANAWFVIRHGRRTGEVRGDLSDAAVADRVIAEAQAECVVNLAAMTDVDRCEAHPREAYRHNTRVVENLARAIGRAVPTSYLIQISTDQVYDGPGPHDEHEVVPSNYYTFSKYAGELAAARVPSTILRTNFFGASQCADRTSFSDWIVRALKRQDAVRVFTDVWFSPLSIGYLSAMICLVLERRINGVFNLGSRDGMSKAQFCYRIAEVLGLSTASMTPTESSVAVLRAYRPKDMRMACGRFERTFEVSLPALAHEIESMKEFYHEHA